MKSFQGVKRRFSFIGKINKASIYDDYAHHPSEIKASYDIAKQISKKRIIVVFQPHRYSRTKILFNDFIKILSKIDVLFILDIYPAGEKSIKNINSKKLVSEIQSYNKNVCHINKKIDLKLILEPYYDNDNTIIFMGAGSITNIAHNIIKLKWKMLFIKLVQN